MLTEMLFLGLFLHDSAVRDSGTAVDAALHRVPIDPLLADGRNHAHRVNGGAERASDHTLTTSSMIAVRQSMTPQLITVEAGTSAIEAATLMRAHRIGSVFVHHEHRIVGLVTETDIVPQVGSGRPRVVFRARGPGDELTGDWH